MAAVLAFKRKEVLVGLTLTAKKRARSSPNPLNQAITMITPFIMAAPPPN